VNYSVASPADAPNSLVYGPDFFALAAKMRGDVTIGLNRQLGNQTNGIQAAQAAKSMMPNLFAFELGNEPDRARFFCCFMGAVAQAIFLPHAVWGTETVATDATSEASWFEAFSSSARCTLFTMDSTTQMHLAVGRKSVSSWCIP
jgi:hypothetical protein